MSSSHSIPTTLHADCVAYLCCHTVPGATPGDAQHQGQDGAAGVLLLVRAAPTHRMCMCFI